MVYKRIIFLAFVLIFILSSLSMAQTRRVKLAVEDTEGRPVEGVEITITSPQKTDFEKVEITDENGETKFLVQMEIKEIHLLLEKEGYQPLKDSLSLRQIRSSQEALYYEQSFVLYGTDELTPRQKQQQYQATQEALAFFNKGMEYFKEEDFKAAAEQFRKATEEKADFLEAYQNLAAAYFRAEQYQKAIEEAKKALELKPDSAQTLKLISVAYSKLGDEETARKYHDRLKELPQTEFSPEEIYNMGVVSANEGQDEEAAEYFKKASEMKPDFALAYYQLGLTYFRLERKEEAKAALEKYLELEPEGEKAETAKTLLNYIKK
ncbi:MAG: tetratricopeptide repeat protein [Candidatus Aminicenantes bacterium]